MIKGLALRGGLAGVYAPEGAMAGGGGVLFSFHWPSAVKGGLPNPWSQVVAPCSLVS